MTDNGVVVTTACAAPAAGQGPSASDSYDELFARYLHAARQIRRRYTVLDLAAETGLLAPSAGDAE